MRIGKFEIVYFLLAILMVGSTIWGEHGNQLNMAGRLLAGISLLVVFIRQTMQVPIMGQQSFILGLMGLFFGNLFFFFIAKKPELLFYGMGAFILAHIMFASTFFREVESHIHHSLSKQFLIIAGASTVFFIWLFQYLDDQKIVGLVWFIILLSQLYFALHRKGVVNDFSYKMILAASILMIIEVGIAGWIFFVPHRYTDPLLLSGMHLTTLIFTILSAYLLVKGMLLSKDR
jgi:uncharacterized membrane protein YhhN